MNIKNLNFSENSDFSENRGAFIQQKITEKIILNKPKFNKKIIFSYKKKIIFIPKDEKINSAENYIPCLFIRNNNSKNFIIFFHGNSEDIFSVESMGLYFKSNLNMNIIIVEYPGYSIYENKKPEPKQIYDDSLTVFNWLKNKLKIDRNNIFIYGRSLGTSPAIYLSSKIQPKALFLVSAFTSIKDIGSDKFCSLLVEDIFVSIHYINFVKCPVLLIHGENDSVISYTHSEKLAQKLEENNIKVHFEKRKEMTHNKFDIFKDIIGPINEFINSQKIILDKDIPKEINEEEINKYFEIPKSIKLKIESEIFNVDEFEISDEGFKNNNSFYLLKLNDERIALSYDTKIGIYDERKFTKDYEIDLSNYRENNHEYKYFLIFSLFQLKNDNIICSTNIGDIFEFKIDLDEYEIVNYFSIGKNEEIFKIDYFLNEEFCSISTNYINFYDTKFEKKLSKSNSKEIIDFNLIPETQRFALLSKSKLYICEKKDNQIIEKISHKLNIPKLNHIMITTNKYILIGTFGGVYIYDHRQNILVEQANIFGKGNVITFIHKIHDELLLASTNTGKILQIKFGDNLNINPIIKTFSKLYINSILFLNFRTILIAYDEEVKIIKNPDKSQDDNCIIL